MRRLIKPAVFVACLIPVVWLIYGAFTHALGANPIETITNETGVWTLRLVAVTLAITPLRKLTRWNALIRYRRMLGLFAFFYGCLHFLTYVWLDQFFAIEDIVADVVKRPFITVGMTVFVILSALAITSNRWSLRKLGRKWQSLHRLVYAAAVGGVIHFWWLVKADITEPRRWAMGLAVLLGLRAWWAYRKRVSSRASLQRAAARP